MGSDAPAHLWFHDDVRRARPASLSPNLRGWHRLAPKAALNKEDRPDAKAHHFRCNSRRWTSALGRDRARAAQALSAVPARAADCSQGSADEKVALPQSEGGDLEAKLAELTKDSPKWNDRISLINEDMRLYPRCLDNPGPSSPDVAAVLASACSKTPAQSWMIRKPYQ